MDELALAPEPEVAACCAGPCGPLFETPLLEQLARAIASRASLLVHHHARSTGQPGPATVEPEVNLP